MFPILAVTLVVFVSFGVAIFGCWALLAVILHLAEFDPLSTPAAQEAESNAESPAALPPPLPEVLSPTELSK